MNATAQALASFSDTGAFETLAAWYIEWSRPEMRGLLQTGVNQEGKSVTGPVDALRILTSADGGSSVVSLAATTTAPKELRRKWLDRKKGDLQKAAEELNRWKQSHPDAHGIVFLVTNRTLDPALNHEVETCALELGIDVEPIDASALVRFLDLDADGQYVREHFLGLPAERLSPMLLLEISEESLENHFRRFPPTHREDWLIDRDATQPLHNLLSRQGVGKIALLGPSGTGKSVILQQVGRGIRKNGGFALWVPPELLKTGWTPEIVVESVLKTHRPKLPDGAGSEAIQLAAGHPGGLTLIVDDINRVPQPPQCLEVINALATAKTACRWLVAVWPGQISIEQSPSDGASPSERPQWKIVEIGRYSRSEQERLKGRVPDQVFRAVDGDPFLCALVSPEVRYSSAESRHEILRSAVENLITAQARTPQSSYTRQGLPPTSRRLWIGSLSTYWMRTIPNRGGLTSEPNSATRRLIGCRY